jgi:ASC-1-like (ASCH) protein
MGDINWKPRIWHMFAVDKVMEFIVSGLEETTGRAPDPTRPEKDYSNMKIGDLIQFKSPENRTHCSRVRSVDRYMGSGSDPARDALHSMFKEHDYSVMEPDAPSERAAVESYLAYPGYEDRISKHGIYAIGLATWREWEFFMPPELFNTFYNDERTVEGRALSDDPKKDYKLMGPGDFALLYSVEAGDEDWRWIMEVNIYESIAGMLNSEGMNELVPGYTDIHQAEELYHSFTPDYKNRIEQYGIAAIHFGSRASVEMLQNLGFWS